MNMSCLFVISFYRSTSLIRNILLVFFLVNLLPSHAQPGQWTWLKGSSQPNAYGNHGTQGVPAPSNVPKAVYEPCEWKDLNGNFWLYGGATHYISYGSTTPVTNDFWKYDPLTNEWTWISGSNNPNYTGSFGIKGISSPTNSPPALGWGILSWTDLNGDLWMYGGYGINGRYSDLWKYNISSNQWTWMKGPGIANQTGVFGTKMVPDTANNPPPVAESAAAWTDLNGDLWYFGGEDYNMMWRYNIATNTWTWMKGTGAVNAHGHWGIKGVEDSLNEPGKRQTYSHWIDNSGNLWLFGGNGLDSSGHGGSLQDMWKFNPVNNNWTWMNGSNQVTSLLGNYGSKCIMDSLNQPVGRTEARSVWKDMQGNFWLFGGFGDNASYGELNDLWKYCVNTNTWTWITGADTANSDGSYGTAGVSSPNNQPRSRCGAVGWSDNNGHLYLFGGLNIGYAVYDFNDLWRFEIDTACAPCASSGQSPIPVFVASDTSFCPGLCVNFTNLTQNATSYLWSFPGGVPSSDTSLIPPQVCYYNSGNYNVSLTATNYFGSNTITLNNIINVFPGVQFNPIVQNGDTLFSVQGYNNYQWYLDTMLIAGATNYFYVAIQSGDYSVQVTDTNGCSATATTIGIIASVNNNTVNEINFDAWYFRGDIYLTINSGKTSAVVIDLFSSTGQLIYSAGERLKAGNNEIELHDVNLDDGIYLLKLSGQNHSETKKIIIR
jgi:PKD repeat protein